jgi:hypothetical protein
MKNRRSRKMFGIIALCAMLLGQFGAPLAHTSQNDDSKSHVTNQVFQRASETFPTVVGTPGCHSFGDRALDTESKVWINC